MSALRNGLVGPQEAEGVPAAAAGAQLGQRVLEPLDVGRRVAGKRRRPQERHFGTVVAGNRGNVLRIGGHDDRREHAALDRRRDRVGEHRMPGEGADVLAGNAFGAEPRRDERDGGGETSGGSYQRLRAQGSRLKPEGPRSTGMSREP
jgi:hypothetical protein